MMLVLAATTMVSWVACMGWYRMVRVGCPAACQTAEQRSWIVTLFSAVVCSLGCLPLVVHFWRTGDLQLVAANDPWSRVLVTFFVTYLAADVFLLRTDYCTPQLVQSTLIHHVPYFLYMSLTLWYGCPAVFVLCFPLEISTIQLALSSMLPAYRRTELLAVLFLVFRVGYHTAMSYQLYRARHLLPLPAVYAWSALPIGMHVFWLGKLVRSLWRHRATANPCVLSSLLFLAIAMWCRDPAYGLSFGTLFVSSVWFHSYPSCWLWFVAHQLCLWNIVLVQGTPVFLAAWADGNWLVVSVTGTCFAGSVLLFGVGRCTHQFCYDRCSRRANQWHAVLHVLSAVGHAALICHKSSS